MGVPHPPPPALASHTCLAAFAPVRFRNTSRWSMASRRALIVRRVGRRKPRAPHSACISPTIRRKLGGSGTKECRRKTRSMMASTSRPKHRDPRFGSNAHDRPSLCFNRRSNSQTELRKTPISSAAANNSGPTSLPTRSNSRIGRKMLALSIASSRSSGFSVSFAKRRCLSNLSTKPTVRE